MIEKGTLDSNERETGEKQMKEETTEERHERG